MNRRLRKHIIRVLMILLLAAALPFGQFTAFAGSAKISFNDPTAGVGEEFTVTVKISTSDGTLGASTVKLSYDPDVLQFDGGNNANGGAGSVILVGTMDSDTTTTFSYKLKFKALKAGDTKITVGDYEVYDVNSQPVNVTKTGSSLVKVQAPSTYSKEAALSSLKVSPGTLDPAFSPNVTSYKVDVGNSTDKILISAIPKDSKAKVVVGDSKLKVGDNKIVCKVTAEDGQTTKSYTLKVHRSETPESTEESTAGTEAAVIGDLKAKIDGVEYSVAASFDPSLLPEGFTPSNITYNGSEIMSGSGKGLTLIYLQNKEGTGSLGIYDADSGAVSPYQVIRQPEASIVVMPIDDTVPIPEGFKKITLPLFDNQMTTVLVEGTDDTQTNPGGESVSGSEEDPSGQSGSSESGASSQAESEGQNEQSAAPGDQSYEYCLVYGMNDKGEKKLYRYDLAEKTFQSYLPDHTRNYTDEYVEGIITDYNSLQKDYNIRFIIIIALIVLSLILFFIIINMILKYRDHGDDGPGRGYREEPETPVGRRIRQEEDRRDRRPSQGRSNRREDDIYQEEDRNHQERGSASRRTAERGYGEPEPRPARPEMLRVYRENPQDGTSGERNYSPERPLYEGRRPRQDGRPPYSERSPRQDERPPYSERSPRQDERAPYSERRPRQDERSPYSERSPRQDERSPYSERVPRQDGRPPYSERTPRQDGRPSYSERAPRQNERPAYPDRPLRREADRPQYPNRSDYENRPEQSNRRENQERFGYTNHQERTRRQESDHQRNYRDFDFRQEDQRPPRGRQDRGMEELLRQREIEREERSRLARERLERERREDERRAGGGRPEPFGGSQPNRPQNRRRSDGDRF